MKWAELGLKGRYPFSEKALSKDDRAIWRSFPADLRKVLAKTNGAVIQSAPTFLTKIKRTQPDGAVIGGQDNWLTQLWAFLPRKKRTEEPKSILGEHFGRHVGEEFLPSGVYVFGECEQSCLVAVSTNKPDYGAIYYWEWYWQYPWYKPFFDARLDKVRKRWPNRKEIHEGHADWPRLRDDFNYATLVKVAPSFTAWVKGMKRAKAAD